MRIAITSRHFKATEKLKTYAETEVRRLKKYYEPIIDCEIILEYDKHQSKSASVHISVRGDRMQATETTDDFYKSIDKAVQKLEKQIHRHKERLKKKH
jgi:putative sigma-54 modulation protein